MKRSRLFKAEMVALLCVVALWGINRQTRCVHRAAAGVMRGVVRVTPNSPVAYELLGIMYESSRQEDRAEEAYDRAECIAAVKTCEEAVRLDPTSTGAHLDLGRAYYHVNDLARAVASFQTAIRIDPNCKDAYSWLNQCFWDRGQYAQAVEVWGQAKTRLPDSEWPYVYLAVNYSDLGLYEQSIQEWRQAVAREPNVPAFCVMMGETYQKAGRYQEAAAAYRQALAINPNSERAQQLLDSLARTTGDKRE